MKRVCNKCKLRKPLSEFYILRNRHYPNGRRQTTCKSCNRKNATAYYQNHKEQCNAAKRRRNAKNRDHVNKVHVQYRHSTEDRLHKSRLLSKISSWKKQAGVDFPKIKYGTCTIKLLEDRLNYLKNIVYEQQKRDNSSEALFTFSFKNEPIQTRRAVIKRLLNEELKRRVSKEADQDVDIDLDGVILETPPLDCGCPPFEMDLNDIPLEDLSCPCGKTKILKFVVQPA